MDHIKKNVSKNKKGFTLIELIVVIAILAVLAMLALPTFNGLINDSKQKVADANARTVYTATKAYITLTPDYEEDIREGKLVGTAKTEVLNFLGNNFITDTTKLIIYITPEGTISVQLTDENDKIGKYPPVN